MKITIKQIVTIAAILMVTAIGYCFWSTNTPDYIKQYEKTIDSAQHNIDSLKTEIIISDKLIDSMNHELAVLDEQNDKLKEKITNIKKQTNEKTDAVTKLNNVELEHFFTERY